MNDFLRDVRFAARAYLERPVFAVASIVSLALGIAATTAIFTLINAALFKRVTGVTHTERLVAISRNVNGEGSDVTYPIYRHLRSETAVLEDLATLALVSVSVGSQGEAIVRAGLVVSSNYFSLLGVRPALGRLLLPNEDHPTAPRVALVSHDVWQTELGGAANVVGRDIVVNGVPLQVIGVLPEGFGGHHTGLIVDVFLPMGADVPGLPRAASLDAKNESSVELLGRLRPGVDRATAVQALSRSVDRFVREVQGEQLRFPYALLVDAWGPLPAVVRGAVSAFLGVLLALVALAFAMACLNVTTILLVRASERQREVAVRRAIGASPWRLVRQMLSETMVLFVVASVLGVVLAWWATGLLSGLAPPIAIPGRLGADMGFDWRVFAFALVASFGASLAVGLVPGMQSRRLDVVQVLRGSGATDTRRRARLRAALVGLQVGVTTVLLAGTLLFGRALRTMRALEPGWDAGNVHATAIDFELNGTASERGLILQQEMIERIAARPDVEHVSLATKLPVGGRSSFGMVRAANTPLPPGQPGIDANLNRVSPEYFRTMRIPLLRGRDFATADVDGAPPVAIVSATMAARVWPDRDAVGETFQLVQTTARTELTVIGVAADAEFRAPGRRASNFYYVPLAQWYNSQFTVHVRTRTGVGDGISTELRRIIRDVDPSLPVPAFRPLAELLNVYLLPQRLAAFTAGAMGLFGLLLAAVGIYGVTAYVAERRRRELAIRVALGATSAQVVRLVVSQGARAPLIGATIGLGLALVASDFLGKVVIGVEFADPVVFIVVPIVLTLVATLAMVVPVRRVVGTSPAGGLRED
jgi:predicted permease